MDSSSEVRPQYYRSKKFTDKEFNCTDPFFSWLRKSQVEVDLYLITGVLLVGFVIQYDNFAILFDGGPRDSKELKEQLVFRTAIATIVPKTKQEEQHESVSR